MAIAPRTSANGIWGGSRFRSPEHHCFNVNIAGNAHGSYCFPYAGDWSIPTTGQKAKWNVLQINVSRVGKSKTTDVAVNGDLRVVLGRWQGAWGTTGNKLLLTISEDGTLQYEADRLKLTMQNNRLLAVGAALHQNFELIPSGTRLIVLGWTVSTQRNPLTDQPDHVAILTRAN